MLMNRILLHRMSITKILELNQKVILQKLMKIKFLTTIYYVQVFLAKDFQLAVNNEDLKTVVGLYFLM